jgi:ABC-type uncharacterized transport system fused permease/ATPase subunit
VRLGAAAIPAADSSRRGKRLEPHLVGGEQQRLAFARLLIDPPDIVIMDEATSALDEVSEAKMMEFLRTDLAHVTVIGVARRSDLHAYFDREITLRITRRGTRRHATAGSAIAESERSRTVPRGFDQSC